MTSRIIKHAVWLTLVAGATAMAAGAPGGGGGGGKGGGGGGGETTLTNNLSVPTIVLGGGSFTGVTCGNGVWSVLSAPNGAPHDGYEIDAAAFYFVQGVNKWQAPCMASSVAGWIVDGAWGDNMTGDAKLKVGSPIRVELVLTDATGMVQQDGYTVLKLEPSKLDRESAYGTLATGATPNFSATATPMTPGVYDAAARLEIRNVNGTVVVPDGTVSAEINATGKVVYGYNLRVTAAGTYVIKFTIPNVTFNACDAGTCAASTAELQIVVSGGGSGGGGKGGGGGGGKPPGKGE